MRSARAAGAGEPGAGGRADRDRLRVGLHGPRRTRSRARRWSTPASSSPCSRSPTSGVRAGLPNADPWLLPLAALLCALGLTEIYRLQPTLARDQSVWIVVGLIGFLGARVRAPRPPPPGGLQVLARRRSRSAAALVTMVAGTTVNGARLWLRHRRHPGAARRVREAAAGDLARRLPAREPRGAHVRPPARARGRHPRRPPSGAAAADGGRRAGRARGDERPRLGAAPVRHLPGDDLRRHRPAPVHGARPRPVRGRVAGSCTRRCRTCSERFSIWIDPWSHAHSTGYQIVQSIESIADGGVFGTGLGRSLQVIGHGQTIIPAVQTDGIYAAWSDETGLAGAAGLLLVYLLFAYRGFKIATLADDSFSKLLACGLTFSFTLQAFLIVGGDHPPDPAHRRDAAVRELRRLVDRLQLPHAGPAPDGLRPRPPRGRRREPPDHHPVPAGGDRDRAPDHDDRLLADLGGRRRSPTRQRQRPAGLPPAADPPRPDPAPRTARPCSPATTAVHKDGQTLYTRRYPFGPLFAHAVGYNTVGDGRTGIWSSPRTRT